MTKPRRLAALIAELACDRKGTSSVEYAVILGMVVLVVFVAMQGVANETINLWQSVSSRSSSAISGQ